MKIRWAIALLLLLNIVTLAWQWDAFARWGWGPNVQREPERLQQQIKPEALQFTLPGQTASAPTPASSPSPTAPASEAAAGKAAEALPAKPTPTPATVAPSSAASAPVSTAPATATQAKPASN